MEESLIRRNLLILGGVTFLLIVIMILAWFYLLVKPQKELIAKTDQTYQARKAVADRMSTALTEQVKAEQRVEYLKGQVSFFQQRYRNLYFDPMGDPATETVEQKAARISVWRRWMNEYYSTYALALRRNLISTANATGVIINTTVKVDAPPQAPEDVAPPPNGIFRPTGGTGAGALAVTVTGSMPNLLQFFNRINLSPILFVIGNVSLQGYSPQIQASFTAVPYLIASGPGVNLQATAAPAAPAGAPPGGAPPAGGAPPPPAGGGGGGGEE